MFLPQSLSLVKDLTQTQEAVWQTLLVQVGCQVPEGFFNLRPKQKYVIKKKRCVSTAQAERYWTASRPLLHLSHANIVTYFGTLICREEDEISLLIAVQFCPKGSLLDLFLSERELCSGTSKTRSQTVTAKYSLVVVEQICQGLEYLHEMQVIHGNLKPSNVLIDLEGNCQLTDFGLRSVCEQASHDPLTGLSVPVSQEYSPPEGTSYDLRSPNRIFSAAGDMFAAGCIMSELVTGVLISERSAKFGSDYQKAAAEALKDMQSAGVSDTILNMSCALLSSQPSERPSASKVLYTLKHKQGVTTQKVPNPDGDVSRHEITVAPFIVPRRHRKRAPDAPSESWSVQDAEDMDITSMSSWSHRDSEVKSRLHQDDASSTVSDLRCNSICGEVQNRKQAVSLRLCADGMEYLTLGKLDLAEKKFKSAIAACPVDTPAAVCFEYGAYIMAYRTNVDEAEKLFIRCLKQDPLHVQCLYSLARLKVNHKEDFAGAEALLNNVLQLAPHHASALRSLGILKANQGSLASGEAALRKSLASDSENVMTLLALGWLLHSQGRIDEAENMYCKVLSHDESSPEAVHLLSLIHRDEPPPPWCDVKRGSNGPTAPSEVVQRGTGWESGTEHRGVNDHATKDFLRPKFERPSLASMYLKAKKDVQRCQTTFHDEKSETAAVVGLSKVSGPKIGDSVQVGLAQSKEPEYFWSEKAEAVSQATGSQKQMSGMRSSEDFPHPKRSMELEVDRKDEVFAKLDVDIIKSRSAPGEQFTEYCLQCGSKGIRWQTWKRFSDFLRLSSQLSSPATKSMSALLPPKCIFGSMSEKVVKYRQVALNRFVTAVAKKICHNLKSADRDIRSDVALFLSFLGTPQTVLQPNHNTIDETAATLHSKAQLAIPSNEDSIKSAPGRHQMMSEEWMRAHTTIPTSPQHVQQERSERRPSLETIDVEEAEAREELNNTIRDLLHFDFSVKQRPTTVPTKVSKPAPRDNSKGSTTLRSNIRVGRISDKSFDRQNEMHSPKTGTSVSIQADSALSWNSHLNRSLQDMTPLPSQSDKQPSDANQYSRRNTPSNHSTATEQDGRGISQLKVADHSTEDHSDEDHSDDSRDSDFELFGSAQGNHALKGNDTPPSSHSTIESKGDCADKLGGEDVGALSSSFMLHCSTADESLSERESAWELEMQEMERAREEQRSALERHLQQLTALELKKQLPQISDQDTKASMGAYEKYASTTLV